MVSGVGQEASSTGDQGRESTRPGAMTTRPLGTRTICWADLEQDSSESKARNQEQMSV